MSDNILIDVSTTLENVNVEVVEASAASIGIEYFYPQGPAGLQGPAGSSLWGTISGTLSAQTDLWRYLSAVGTSNFDIVTLNNYLSTTPVLLSSLNVKGAILSAGIPLHNIFLTSETDSQILSYDTQTETLSISNGNSVSLASLNDKGYVNANFLALSGGLVSGPVRINNNLTVFGNLTASGTSTFANTVFSTTTALSVVHIGSDPAVWVGNFGDGDIASFYDIDQNIEILHIGGQNGSFPNVGVKTSQPNKDFTVKGELSASSVIYDSIGNSNQWNQAYNIATTYQGASSSFATNTTLNSVSSVLKAFRGGITVTVGRANCDFNCSGSQASPVDHITIQSAINSISATGGEVFIAEGTYYLNNTINIRVPNISIVGTGRATQLLAVDDYGDVFNCALSSVPSQWPGMAGLQFSQLRFETTVPRTFGAAIRADDTHNAIFRDLYICDTTYGVSYGLVEPVPPAFYDGIYLDGQDQCHVSKVVAQCSNYSVHVNGSGYANADFSYDGYIENCDFYGVPGSPRVGTGIHLGPNCGGLVIDYVSMNQLDYGVYADATGTTQGGGILTIRGGYVENASGHGYYIKGYQNTVIEQLWGELRVDGGNTLVLGVPNGSIIVDNGNALVYGTPGSITGAGTWTVIDTVGGGGGSTTNNNKYIYLTSSVTLTSNYKFSVNTTASTLTATLPSTPEQGDEIELFDIAGTWNTNNLVVNNNTKLIEGYNDSLLCNVQYGLFKLIYTGNSVGWHIVPMPTHTIVPPVTSAPPPPLSADPYSDYVSLLLHFNP